MNTNHMGSQPAFCTKRLRVELLVPATGHSKLEGALLYEMKGILVREVLQHLPEQLQLPNDANPIECWVAARQAESCLYTVREAGTDALVGLMILADTSEFDATPTLRLGYLFGQFAWGKGYATELVTGLVKRLGENEWSGQILAGVTRANAASSRVLRKSGFDEVQDTEITTFRTFRTRL